MVNWSELPNELLISVAERIGKLEDFIAFGAVCKGWNAAGKKEYFKGLWLRQGTPYLMIRNNDDTEDVTCGFYGLVENKIVASIRISKFRSKMCHESLGWLLAVEKNGSMCLMNPFTSVEIPVPHQQTFPDYGQIPLDGHVYIQKMVLSARPSETSDFILMVICDLGKLAFWRPGDQSWNKIKIPNYSVRDVMYHDGHFYAVAGGYAWAFTIGRDAPQVFTCLLNVANHHACRHERMKNYFHILKTSQSLFLISRTAPWFIEKRYRWCYHKSKFHVYEIDTSACTLAEINNIGSMAVFVGHNATFAIDTCRFSGTIKGNRFYLTQDGWEYSYCPEKGLPKTWGEYNMETGTIEMRFPEDFVLLTNECPPIWITPCF